MVFHGNVHLVYLFSALYILEQNIGDTINTLKAHMEIVSAYSTYSTCLNGIEKTCEFFSKSVLMCESVQLCPHG